MSTALFAGLYLQNNSRIQSLNQSTQSLSSRLASDQTSESQTLSSLTMQMAKMQSNLTQYVQENANLRSEVASYSSTVGNQSAEISEYQSTISSQSTILNGEANVTLLNTMQIPIPPSYNLTNFYAPYNGVVVFSVAFIPQGTDGVTYEPITANESGPLDTFYLTLPFMSQMTVGGQTVYIGYFPVLQGTVSLNLGTPEGDVFPTGTLVIDALLLY